MGLFWGPRRSPEIIDFSVEIGGASGRARGTLRKAIFNFLGLPRGSQDADPASLCMNPRVHAEAPFSVLVLLFRKYVRGKLMLEPPGGAQAESEKASKLEGFGECVLGALTIRKKTWEFGKDA